LRGIVEIVREYDWPGCLADDRDERSERTARVVVTTSAELRVGEPFVRVEVTFTARRRITGYGCTCRCRRP
jgi:hypothetical protein